MRVVMSASALQSNPKVPFVHNICANTVADLGSSLTATYTYWPRCLATLTRGGDSNACDMRLEQHSVV